MTEDKNFKRLVRRTAAQTGQRYTSARAALRRDGDALPSWSTVLQAAAEVGGHSVEELRGPSRNYMVVRSRQLAMYVLSHVGRLEVATLAGLFARRPDVVTHAIAKVQARIDASDATVIRSIDEILERAHRPTPAGRNLSSRAPGDS